MPSYSPTRVLHRKSFLSFPSLPSSSSLSSSSSFLPSSLHHGFLRLSSSSQKTPSLPLFSFFPYLQKDSFFCRNLSLCLSKQRRLESPVGVFRVKEEEDEEEQRKLQTRRIPFCPLEYEDIYESKEGRRSGKQGKVGEERRLITTQKEENSRRRHSASFSLPSQSLFSSFFCMEYPSLHSPSLSSQSSSSLSFLPSLRFSSRPFSSSSSSFSLSHRPSSRLAISPRHSPSSLSSSSSCSSPLSTPLLSTGLHTREKRDVRCCQPEKEREERRRETKERSTFSSLSSSLVSASSLSSKKTLAGCLFLFLSDNKGERTQNREASEEEKKKKIKSLDVEKQLGLLLASQRHDCREGEGRKEEEDDERGGCRQRQRVHAISSSRETLCSVYSLSRDEGKNKKEEKRKGKRQDARGRKRRREMLLSGSSTSSYRQGDGCLASCGVEEKSREEKRRKKRIVEEEGRRAVEKRKGRSSERRRDRGDSHAKMLSRERRISRKRDLEERRRLSSGKKKIFTLSRHPMSFSPSVVNLSHPSPSSLSLHRGVHTPGKKVAKCQEETLVSSSFSPLSFLSFSPSHQENRDKKDFIQRSSSLSTRSEKATEEEDFSGSSKDQEKKRTKPFSSFLSRKPSFLSESLDPEEEVSAAPLREDKESELEPSTKTIKKKKDEEKEREEGGYEEELGEEKEKISSAFISRVKWKLLMTYKILQLLFVSSFLAIGAGSLLGCLYIIPYIRRWRDKLGGWIDYLTFFTIPKGEEEEEQVKRKVENALFHLIGFAAGVAGPTYLKCLQWVGTRRDLFPQHLCDFCARYQRQPADSSFVYPHVSLLLERRFGKNWRDELILDPCPIGSGCIAVVYRGLLRLHVKEASAASQRSFLSQAYYPFESPHSEEDELVSPPCISRSFSASKTSSSSDGALASTSGSVSARGEGDISSSSSSSSSSFAPQSPSLVETREEEKKRKKKGEEQHEGDRVRSVGNEEEKKKKREERDERERSSEEERQEKRIDKDERKDEDLWMCVAVKVVKPMTRQSMEVDLHLLCAIARFVDSLPGFQWISLTPGAEEFASTMRSQLDLKKEALHLLQFRENFGLPNPVFPLSLTRLVPASRSPSSHANNESLPLRDGHFSPPLLSSSMPSSSPAVDLASATCSSPPPPDLPSPSSPSSSFSFSSFLSLPLLKEAISSYLPFSSWGTSRLLSSSSSSSPGLLKRRSASPLLAVFPFPVLPLCDEEFLVMSLEQGIPLDLLLQHSARNREEERRRTGRGGWVMLRGVRGKGEGGEKKKERKRGSDTTAEGGEEEEGRGRGLLEKESKARMRLTREEEGEKKKKKKNVYESELVNAAQLACEQMKAERERIGRVALHTFLKMLLIDNFLHADLHPGNILVRRGISLLPPSSSSSLLSEDFPKKEEEEEKKKRRVNGWQWGSPEEQEPPAHHEDENMHAQNCRYSSSSSPSFFSSPSVAWKDEQLGMDVLSEDEGEGRERETKSLFSSSSGSARDARPPSSSSSVPVIPLARYLSSSSSFSDGVDSNPSSSKEDLDSFSSSSSSSLSSSCREMEKEKKEKTSIEREGRRYRYEPYLQLIFLDCGLVAALYGKDRENFLLLLQAIALNKGIEAGHLLVERARKKLQGSDAQAFERGVASLVTKYHSQEGVEGVSSFRFASLNVGELFAKVLDLSRRYQIILDSQFANVFLAMTILDGVGKQLNPHVDVMKTALPYALTAVKNLYYSSSSSSSSSSTSSSLCRSSSSSTSSPTSNSSTAVKTRTRDDDVEDEEKK